MPTNVRDPRSIITPHAFDIAPSLLGLPLARPTRRLAALLIDIVVIGVLTGLTSGFGVFIWGFVGLFLLRMAFGGTGDRLGQVTSVLFRGSAGCLGATILLVVSLMGLAQAISRDEDISARVESVLSEAAVERFAAGAFQGLEPAIRLGQATSREEAVEASQQLLGVAGNRVLELGNDDEGLAALVRAIMGDSPEYTDDPDAFSREMVALFREGAPESAPATALSEAEAAALDALPPVEAMARFQEGLDAGRTPATDAAQARLRDRLAGVVAADTVRQLQEALAAEARRRSRAEDNLVEARDEAASEGEGIVALLRDIWDQAGSAVGLWSIYFTVTMTLFQGFTVGKRIMGIRVVRLDGERFTWWTSFERAGGYVAGIATGLLGFAQVYWDPNRQCVHDKIVGTAVVMAGAEPIPGAVESAWTAAPEPER